MTFIWPYMLLFLLLVPVLAAVYILMQRRRRRYAVRYASLSLVKEALGRGPGIRRHVPPALFLLSLTAMFVAFARPQSVVTLPENEGTVILTIDTSGSMQADDVKPNRMEAAKAAARAFVERQPPTVQIGVVSFSDNAFLVQAPTTNQDAVIAAINRLEPQRGTAIGRGIITSLTAIVDQSGSEGPSTNGTPLPAVTPTPTPMPPGVFAPAIIILLTDGENNQWPDPLDVVQSAVQRGIRIYTVGLGSAEGSILHIGGRSIRTRLDEGTLRQIAQVTNANYYNASNETDLRSVYENLDTRLVLKTQKTEITAMFTGLGILFALFAGTLSLLWFNRLP
jgi:Ca-activated chloride channel family protein